MRSIQHPGKPDNLRIQSQSGRAQSVHLTLVPGASLLYALTQALEPFGAKSAVMRLENGAFESFCYVMPALSKSPDHAVYFSERFDVKGKVRLLTASVTYGVRKGQPWLHCHAVWLEPDGTRRCGHLLPDEIQVCEPIDAFASVLREVAFSVEPDSETNFSLFVPIKISETALGTHQTSLFNGSHKDHSVITSDVYALRLSPNIDVCISLEKFCQTHQIAQATVLGGVGSTVGAVFEDGRVVEPFVTEMLIRKGRICCDDHQTVTEIDISMVDYQGGFSQGRLKRGANPVLVTFELVLQVDKLHVGSSKG